MPITTFSVAEVVQAYRYFSSKDRVGKIVISFENDAARIPLAPSKYSTLFHLNKVYLLVGCLGGLGRSLSHWMVARGARHFVFLGRSGSENPHAKDLISQLRGKGASITVVRGNVCNMADVGEAVRACITTGYPLGGVVQGAMGLSESLFSYMTIEAWQTAIQPKWKGTLNLHSAINGHDSGLDFFLLMSSVSGSVGTATESNYCAANGFLDAFAHWRQLQGKPAISVGLGMISEVGYLHENPDIEALLLRKGIQPLNEAEFLQVIDLALSKGASCGQGQRRPWSCHVLTGLEPLGIRRLMDQGFDVSLGVADDPRTAILSSALVENIAMNMADDTGSGFGQSHFMVATSTWLNSVPESAAKSLSSEANAPSLQVAVSQLLRRKFSNLILVPHDQIGINEPLAKFGLDSMIASEFRSWLWSAFQVDIPFLDLLSPSETLGTLAGAVEKTLVESQTKSE